MSPTSPSQRIWFQDPAEHEHAAQKTITKLQSLLIHDAETEARLAEVEAEVEKLRRKRSRLQRQVFHCRAANAPVHRIPSQILEYIFEFLVAASPDTIAQLRTVCNTWRVASTFPRLWNTLLLVDGSESPRGQKKAVTFLQNSRQVPLDITYVQSAPDVVQLYNILQPWKTWNTIISAASRWRSLTLEFYDSRVARHRLDQGSLDFAPQLQELTLTIQNQFAQPGHDGYFGLDIPSNATDILPLFFPLLHTLRLHTFVLPPAPGGIFHQLTVLHIHDTFSQLKSPQNNPAPMNAMNILTVLASCLNLQEFDLKAAESYHWYVVATQARTKPETPMIHLPALLRLSIDCHFFVGHCIMDNLTTFNLKVASVSLHPRHEIKEDYHLATATTNFLNRAPNLHTLTILGLHRSTVLAGCIRGFHLLESLHIGYMPGLDDIFGRLASDRSFPTRHIDWSAPKLYSIEIDTDFDVPDGEYAVPIDKIEKFVEARYLSNQRCNFPRAITQLTINKRDMLKGAPPGKILQYPRKQRFVGYTKHPLVW